MTFSTTRRAIIYYFFAKKDGTVIYSKTLAEHEKAVSENKWY